MIRPATFPGLDPPPGSIATRVLDLVEADLVARHRREARRRINAESVDAFEGCGIRLLSPDRRLRPAE